MTDNFMFRKEVVNKTFPEVKLRKGMGATEYTDTIVAQAQNESRSIQEAYRFLVDAGLISGEYPDD